MLVPWGLMEPVSTAERALIQSIRVALAEAGDPERAAARQAYMKSPMPYSGVAAAQLKALLRPLLASYRPADRIDWEATVRDLWDGATHREERYAATALARHRVARAWQDPDTMELYRHLIVTGAWWDHVDEIASHLVGGVLASYRSEVTPVMRKWAVDDDLWLRRTAVICQLRHRDGTDLDLLRLAIEANVDGTSFWLRKTIGWALREHAKTDPGWVRAEVDRLEGRLSGLSRREALRHLG
jgi:3-methyladenine DNA glycosylase AlkD